MRWPAGRRTCPLSHTIQPAADRQSTTHQHHMSTSIHCVATRTCRDYLIHEAKAVLTRATGQPGGPHRAQTAASAAVPGVAHVQLGQVAAVRVRHAQSQLPRALVVHARVLQAQHPASEEKRCIKPAAHHGRYTARQLIHSTVQYSTVQTAGQYTHRMRLSGEDSRSAKALAAAGVLNKPCTSPHCSTT